MTGQGQEGPTMPAEADHGHPWPTLQTLMGLNPLVIVIEQSRRVLVQGVMPSAGYVIAGSVLMLGLCELSYRFFCKARRGFADVL